MTNDIEEGEDITKFMVKVNREKIEEGMRLQGVGGGIWKREQIREMRDSLEEAKVAREIVLDQEFMFSEHVHDIKIYRVLVGQEKVVGEEDVIYILETFEVDHPEVVYSAYFNMDSGKNKT